MARRFPRLLTILLVLATLLLAAYLVRPLWLPAVAQALVRNDGPAKADIAVVLAGDYLGNRIVRAAELVRNGYVPAVLVDGPGGVYGMHESTIAIQYVTAKGYPAAWFVDFPIDATSTVEEAHVVLPELRRRDVHSYLLVTSEFHSARAARIFQATQKSMGYNAAMRVVTAPDAKITPANWYLTREGKKAAFLEWVKTVTSVLGQ